MDTMKVNEEYENKSDIALMKDISRGDIQAFHAFVKRYVGLVWTTSFRVLCDREDSKHVTLKTFSDLKNDILQYDDRLSVEEWVLQKTCHNCRIRIVRRKILRMYGVTTDLFVRAAPVVEDHDDYIVKQSWELFCRAAVNMNPLQNITFVLYALEEVPQGRIALILGVSGFRVALAFRHAQERVMAELKHYKREDDYDRYIFFLKKVADSLKSDEIFTYICGHL